MSKTKFLKLVWLLPLTALFLSGCTIGFNTGSGADASLTDGGIYKSLNKGTLWNQKVLIQTVGSKRSFNTVDIISSTLDPEDSKAIYAGSIGNGLFYSYDGGEGWQIATGLGKVTVTNVAVDPANKCVIYATAANKVYKSVDCSRAWAITYFDNDPAVIITALVIDSNNNNNVFIGTSRGEIIKSLDRGASWQTLNRFESPVDRIVISPVNAKIIFVGAFAKGIFRTTDGGSSWVNLSDKLKVLDGTGAFRDLAMVKAEKPTVFLATNFGFIKSADDGETWSKIELIIEKARIKINAIAINPFDTNEIYYVTDTTFYRSLDGGKNWSSNKLPSSRTGFRLLIDPKNPSIIYLAVKQIPKKK
ncbi:MAG: hypothetical protein Q7K35_01850 [bacterium]|nr:hypothetical protein [bacterium]